MVSVRTDDFNAFALILVYLFVLGLISTINIHWVWKTIGLIGALIGVISEIVFLVQKVRV
jgi:cytochrome c oxidase subunit IV